MTKRLRHLIVTKSSRSSGVVKVCVSARKVRVVSDGDFEPFLEVRAVDVKAPVNASGDEEVDAAASWSPDSEEPENPDGT